VKPIESILVLREEQGWVNFLARQACFSPSRFLVRSEGMIQQKKTFITGNKDVFGFISFIISLVVISPLSLKRTALLA
jgi:hypothetical protein